MLQKLHRIRRKVILKIKKDEFIKHHLHILNKEFPGFESLYLDKLNGKSLNTLGAHLLSMYEVLQDRIEGKTYSEVRQGLRDNDTSKRREAEELVKAFEYSNITRRLCRICSKIYRRNRK